MENVCVARGVLKNVLLFDTGSAATFRKISMAILNDVIWLRGVTRNHWNLEKRRRNKSNFFTGNVSADGLAPLSARPSAGTVMTT